MLFLPQRYLKKSVIVVRMDEKLPSQRIERMIHAIREFLHDKKPSKRTKWKRAISHELNASPFPSPSSVFSKTPRFPPLAAVNASLTNLTIMPPSVGSPRAFDAAQQKINPQLFADLNYLVAQHFYHDTTAVTTAASDATTAVANASISATDTAPDAPLYWKGHRLLAIDGSRMVLPDTPEIRTHFPLTNTYSRPKGFHIGLASFQMDVLNRLILSAELLPISPEKEAIFAVHQNFWQPQDIILLDRQYDDYSVIAWLVAHRVNFVIRTRKGNTFKPVEHFFHSPATDATVTLHCPRRQREFVARHKLPCQVTVRVVKIFLPTGDIELLLTSLKDTQRYPREALGWLYHQRWTGKTDIGQLKNILTVERFPYKRLQKIYQHFYGMIFLLSLGAALTHPLQPKTIPTFDDTADDATTKDLTTTPQKNIPIG